VWNAGFGMVGDIELLGCGHRAFLTRTGTLWPAHV